jgi:hypothetical protein
MKTAACWVLLLAGVFPLGAQPKAQLESSKAVTFYVVDEFGAPVGDVVVKQFEAVRGGNSGGVDFASQFNGLRATGIPWGGYKYTLQRGDPERLGEKIFGITNVSNLQSEDLIVIPVKRQVPYARVSVDRGSGQLVRGRLTPAPASDAGGRSKRIWVRLSPVHAGTKGVSLSSALGPGIMDIPVDAKGEFFIDREPVGQYVLIVIRGEEILHVEPISFGDTYRGADLIVNIPARSPAVHRVQSQ